MISIIFIGLHTLLINFLCSWFMNDESSWLLHISGTAIQCLLLYYVLRIAMSSYNVVCILTHYCTWTHVKQLCSLFNFSTDDCNMKDDVNEYCMESVQIIIYMDAVIDEWREHEMPSVQFLFVYAAEMCYSPHIGVIRACMFSGNWIFWQKYIWNVLMDILLNSYCKKTIKCVCELSKNV